VPARPHIETFASWFKAWSEEAHQLVASAHPTAAGDLTPPTGRISRAAKAIAEVNESRWIAPCPFEYDGRRCRGAELVNFETALFFCASGCRNAAVGHDYIHVGLPDPAKREQIEQLLLERPLEQNRHWLPHETATDLKRQNKRARDLGLMG